MKFADLKTLSAAELNEKAALAREDLRALRFSAHNHQLKQVHKIKIVHKEIARFQTALRAQALANQK
jgi:ribosomal protein L29